LLDQDCPNEKPSYITECDDKYDCEKYRRLYILNNKELYSDSNTNLGILTYSGWSKCSARCGPGTRTRSVKCTATNDNSIELPLEYCNNERMGRLEMPCHLVNCNYRLIEKWSKCSKACGQQGIETSERSCLEMVTRTYVNLTYCGIKADDTQIIRQCYRPCQRHVKRNYEWRANSWGQCDKCGLNTKTRHVYCWSNHENSTVHDSNCVIKDKPISALPCMNASCGYGWFVSKWSKVKTKLNSYYLIN
jgi:hypothetical protein